jgi:hypothetical protein
MRGRGVGVTRSAPRAQEMCVAAGVPDGELPDALGQGFLLAGNVPGLPGGRLDDARPAKTSLDELWEGVPELNAATLDRVARDGFADADVEAAFDVKVAEDVVQGRARRAYALCRPPSSFGRASRWIPLPNRRLLTPRFVVDGGWKWKGDKWQRKARPRTGARARCVVRAADPLCR